MRPFHFPTFLASVLLMFTLAACSPEYNWRDYRSPHAPFTVMFPDKPSTHTREVNLNGLVVAMTMTAVDINGNMFAVGTAEAPDAARAQAALAAMKTALVNNIGATIKSEKAGKLSAAAGARSVPGAAIDLEAVGQNKGEAMRLVGHFEARDKRFYQVIVMGKARELTKENVDMFMSSFQLQ
ncbi:hypothetical protein KY495_05015 [Massilia sp. PAMC28688]|uniref:hypothetical protein n=1 Tax=Massilia sp. PAMC28688 TaxID=2861283 RepID=UPI001C63AC14|nr:hypothetical protein [Massilia sp. PAMC28688]QYF94580.1 hypothetical protein KY495_05015 [Massilia sp. PAMC28688]